MIYESTATKNKAGQKCAYFSLVGNVDRKGLKVTGYRKGLKVTGYTPTRLGEDKQDRIEKALQHPDTDKVYRRDSKIYKLLLNGREVEI